MLREAGLKYLLSLNRWILWECLNERPRLNKLWMLPQRKEGRMRGFYLVLLPIFKCGIINLSPLRPASTFIAFSGKNGSRPLHCLCQLTWCAAVSRGGGGLSAGVVLGSCMLLASAAPALCTSQQFTQRALYSSVGIALWDTPALEGGGHVWFPGSTVPFIMLWKLSNLCLFSYTLAMFALPNSVLLDQTGFFPLCFGNINATVESQTKIMFCVHGLAVCHFPAPSWEVWDVFDRFLVLVSIDVRNTRK